MTSSVSSGSTRCSVPRCCSAGSTYSPPPTPSTSTPNFPRRSPPGSTCCGRDRDRVFLEPRRLDFYVNTFESCGLVVEPVSEQAIEAGVTDWFEFLAAYHDAVLGWVGGTDKVDGAAATPAAVNDRLRLMRQSMDVLFGGRDTFQACWTYITCRKP